MPVTVIATFHAADGKRDELLAAVVQAVPGCCSTRVLAYAPHTVGKDRVMLVESWESPDALKVHSQNPVLIAFRDATSHLLAAPTDVVVARPVAVG